MKTIYVDTDNTLVFSAAEQPGRHYDHLPSILIDSRAFYINTAMVNLIKDCKARGHKIIVWSAGGEEWAMRVVNQLGLQAFVYETLSKPDFLFDDKQTKDWLPKVDYIEPPAAPQDVIKVAVKDITDVIYSNISGAFHVDWHNIDKTLRERSKQFS